MTETEIRLGRIWAYIGTIFGVTMSSTANLIETLINPEVPNVWEAIAATFMGLLPVGLFVALEVLVRNRIKDHLLWWRVGMMVAALAFAVPSYLHMHWLLLDWGQGVAIALITPLGWDAMMLLSTLALLLPPKVATKVQPQGKVESPGRQVVQEAVAELADESHTPLHLPTGEKPPKQAGATGKRLARPTDHPMHAEWLRRRATADPLRAAELAKVEQSTQPAARARLNRWERALAAPDNNSEPRLEVESFAEREEALV